MLRRAVTAIAMLAASRHGAAAQPLAPIRDAGQTVTPVFEGWYKNADGTYTLSFGYFNRNAKEIVEIPVGPDNFITPDGPDRGQPTQFQPRRQWGTFGVVVPADFNDRVEWTLVVRGDTLRVPGKLQRGWEIDAIQGEAGTGNTPPEIRFDSAGPAGRGPAGITAGPVTVAVGKPLALTVWARDDGKALGTITGAGRAGVPVTLTWLKHQGPGNVTFSNATPRVDPAGGKSTATAVFDAPGNYILRVRANDASGIVAAGHAQCCWTNGFLRVLVTP